MESSSKPLRYLRDQDEARSSSIYAESIIRADIEKVKGLVEKVLLDEEEEAKGGEGEGEGGGGEGVEAGAAASEEWRWVEGMNCYVNIETGERRAFVDVRADESRRSREQIVANVMDKDRLEIAGFMSVADAYGHAARLALGEQRDSSKTIQLRRACNFLKDGPIRVSLAFWILSLREKRDSSGIRVLDLCCGRGQDFDKYRRICRDSSWSLEELVGVDISSGAALSSANERWQSMAHHNRPVATQGGVLSGDLSQGHAAMVINEAARRAGWRNLPEINSFHMASCMFALHYFFKDEMSLRNLVAGAGFLLREGGFFACVHADGEAMAAAYLEHGRHPRIKIGLADITFHEGTRAMLDGGLREQYKDRPFGWAYDFHLPGAVENVTEYMVHSPTRDRIFEHYHFIKVFDESAETTVNRMRDVSFWDDTFSKCAVDCDGSGRLAEETWDHLALYRVVIYTKSPLKVDVNVVRKFIRSKLGFASSGIVVKA